MRRTLVSIELLLAAAGLGLLLLVGAVRADDPPDEPTATTEEANDESDGDIELTQDIRPPRPAVALPPEAPALPAAAAEFAASLAGPGTNRRALLSQARRERTRQPTTDVVLGSDSKLRPSSDVGSLLGKSEATVGVAVQKRTPIVSDTRIRGSHLGQLLGAGSYWVPARQDLDTILSKLDSGVISDAIVIKGPYSVRYGPGFSFIDTALLPAPRYDDGPQWHGLTSLNYQTNGEQWYGRQAIMGGASDWGFRLGYGHRTGNDYETGDDTDIPASYNSRVLDTAIGLDLSPDSHLELSCLRLDQTDVEFPGQIFDMDFLVTDGYELKYVLENQCYYDRLTFDTWYNRTRFEGDAQRSGKRRQIPQLDDPLDFIGFTDVDVMSTGYRLDATWGEADGPQLTCGVDLRYVEQELNELDTFTIFLGVPPIPIRRGPENFPIPRSHSSNPGLFLEEIMPLGDRLALKAGTRVDWVSTNIEGTPRGRTRAELEQLLATDDFDKEFNLWAAYLAGEYRPDPHWTVSAGVGYAERPPTLTELYAVQSFLAILQQGFTSVVGDPSLDEERLWQIDLGLRGSCCQFRGGISGFYAWVQDYITYEALGPVLGQTTVLGVQFVNTDLATLSGGELWGEFDWNEWLTPFARLSYVEGRDHSRGSRGLLSGSDEEPLPGIAPLETRLGLRLHEPSERPHWGIELAARVVGEQDRVASSLLERETPGFTVWDLRSFWQATDGLLLVAGVENFTDKHYREHLDLRTGTGVFQPGASFYFGVELAY